MYEAFNHTKSILPEYSLPKGRKYLQEGVSEAGPLAHRITYECKETLLFLRKGLKPIADKNKR
jgi:hypothetical protein